MLQFSLLFPADLGNFWGGGSGWEVTIEDGQVHYSNGEVYRCGRWESTGCTPAGWPDPALVGLTLDQIAKIWRKPDNEHSKDPNTGVWVFETRSVDGAEAISKEWVSPAAKAARAAKGKAAFDALVAMGFKPGAASRIMRCGSDVAVDAAEFVQAVLPTIQLDGYQNPNSARTLLIALCHGLQLSSGTREMIQDALSFVRGEPVRFVTRAQADRFCAAAEAAATAGNQIKY